MPPNCTIEEQTQQVSLIQNHQHQEEEREIKKWWSITLF